MQPLPPEALPAPDHPLYPLFVLYKTAREDAVAKHEEAERLAPTPPTMSGPDPADALTGETLQAYLVTRALAWAAEGYARQLHSTLCAVVQNLGGM